MINVAHPQASGELAEPHLGEVGAGKSWVESVVSGDGSVRDVLALECEGCEHQVVQALLQRQQEGGGGFRYHQITIAQSK